MPTEQTPQEFEKTVAATGTPEALSASDLWVREFALKALSTNTAAVRYGFSSTDGSQLWELTPTEWRSHRAKGGKKYNLKNVYIDVDVNGEGVVCQYER